MIYFHLSPKLDKRGYLRSHEINLKGIKLIKSIQNKQSKQTNETPKYENIFNNPIIPHKAYHHDIYSQCIYASHGICHFTLTNLFDLKEICLLFTLGKQGLAQMVEFSICNSYDLDSNIREFSYL